MFTLSRTTPVDSDSANPLSAKLNVTVVDCGAFAGATAPTCGDGDDVTKYSAGTLAQMGTPGHLVSSLGSFAGNEQHRYEFRVALDGSAGERLPGRQLLGRVRLQRRLVHISGQEPRA